LTSGRATPDARNSSHTVPDDLKRLAIAVECFHKASLVHDDIEDEDDVRYGEATLHVDHGTAVALNVGDLLVGEGYRLIGECLSVPDRIGGMLRVASNGHRTLCLGQGAELVWTRNPQPLNSLQVLDIFRQKTAPAFDVALQLGALFAGDTRESPSGGQPLENGRFNGNGSHTQGADAPRSGMGVMAELIAKYSESLGIAYQIRDDLDDLDNDEEPDDILAMRPSLPLALLYERTKAKPEQRAVVERAWRRTASAEDLEDVRRLMEEYDIRQRCQVLQESYKEEAIRALANIDSASLKGLLRRVISKIFTIEVQGWCSEFESRNAASGAALPQDAG
jgi:geranylgeranyl diphosphate synthase, type II